MGCSTGESTEGREGVRELVWEGGLKREREGTREEVQGGIHDGGSEGVWKGEQEDGRGREGVLRSTVWITGGREYGGEGGREDGREDGREK